jgi:PAS domain S-box-containing protein
MLLSTFEAGFRSIMNVPLFSKGKIIGGLLLRSQKPYAYTERDVRLAERIASQIAGAVANAQLYAERSQAEEALRKSEERFRQVAENAGAWIWEVDATGLYTYSSPIIEKILGYKAEEIVGKKHFYDLFDPDSRVELKKKAFEIFAKKEAIKGFVNADLHKNGSRIFLATNGAPIMSSNGDLLGYRGADTDITQRMRAEEEKTALQEQLRQSQKMEAIGRLAGGIAHDFNNLLTVIKGYSQLSLNDTKENDPLRGNIEEIKKASDRAADLTRQLLAFSRRQVMEMKVLDLNTTLQNLDKMLRRVIGEDIELVTLLEKDLGRVKTDPGQIEQVIMNLAVNARDAMPKGGKLTIETANVDLDQAYARAHIAVTPGRYIMISVSDTGVGMTPEIRDRVFEPFFTTKDKGKGTGLGLSTVYGIVKQSGGNIWVYSEPGKGTTFKIYLPRVDEPLEELGEKVVREQLPQGSETILIVEDDEEVRKLAIRILRTQGYTVLEACQGKDALSVLEKHKKPIDLLLSDVVMPGMDGRELAKQLGVLYPGMKVLYMSGYTDNAIVHHGVLYKGMNYIQKPFTIDGLARKVREVLDK